MAQSITLHPLHLASGMLLAAAVILVPLLWWFRAHVIGNAESARVTEWESACAGWEKALDRQLRHMEDSAGHLAITLDEALNSTDQANLVVTEVHADGIWRTPRVGFDDARHCAVWIPPYAAKDSASLRGYQTMAEILAVFGLGAVDGVLSDAYVITADGANLLFFPGHPNYIWDTSTETDYRASEWMMVTRPERNAGGRPAWTPPIWDPAAKAWWVGISAPIHRHGAFAGCAGHDIIASGLLADVGSHERLIDTHIVIMHDGQAFMSNRMQERMDSAHGKLPVEQIPERFGGGALRSLVEGKAIPPDWLVHSTQIRGPGWTVVALRDRRTIIAAVHSEFYHLWLLIGLPVLVLCTLAGIGLRLGERASRRTIATLRESEDRFRLIIERAPEAIVLVDGTGVFIEANARAEVIFGVPHERILGANLLHFCPECQPDGEASNTKVERFISAALAGNEQSFMWHYRRLDGTDVPCEVRLVALPWNGQQVVRGSIIDLTERRRHEAQLRHNETLATLGQLAGSVAHDFNNLLTGIGGNSELIRLRSQESRVLVCTARIDEAVKQATALTTGLMRIARQGAGEEPVRYDVHAAITVAASLFRSASLLPVTLNLHSGRNQIFGWQAQLQNAVLNLLLNARDAMPTTGGSVDITTCEEFIDANASATHRNYAILPGMALRMDVRDTGAGMSPEVLSRCLEPFFTTKGERGTGLGLASVHAAVSEHRGAMRITSRPGQGTTFTIWLPLAAGV